MDDAVGRHADCLLAVAMRITQLALALALGVFVGGCITDTDDVGGPGNEGGADPPDNGSIRAPTPVNPNNPSSDPNGVACISKTGSCLRQARPVTPKDLLVTSQLQIEEGEGGASK
jgi:hypothetical protein